MKNLTIFAMNWKEIERFDWMGLFVRDEIKDNIKVNER